VVVGDQSAAVHSIGQGKFNQRSQLEYKSTVFVSLKKVYL
jgi:hypothetical protein